MTTASPDAPPDDEFSTFDVERSAEIVKASFRASGPRLGELLGALVDHLHAFVKEVGLSPEEWVAAVTFLTETGQTCDDVRQEFVLLSDVLGVSMLVESLHGPGGHLTEATVEGPFHLVASPLRELGDDLNDSGRPGEPCLFTGTVVDEAGHPVAGAKVDVWQADADGWYDVQRPAQATIGELRGEFTADSTGRFWFRTIVPSHYPIPTDGPVGRLLRAGGRHEFRPAHIHLQVSAPGLRTVTTHAFVGGSPYLGSDAVFGVKESLVVDFVTVDQPELAAAAGVRNPFRRAEFPVVLQRLTRHEPPSTS
jgi:hydroxyquinol 1,2-dioxygenase